MAHAPAARLVATALVLAAVAAGCGPKRVVVAPDTVAALSREPRILAVHYYDLIPPPPAAASAMPAARWITMAAPTRRIKERFVREAQARLGLQNVRDVTEPRFAYIYRFMPEVVWLQRTFGRGLVLEFYSPWRPRQAGLREGSMVVHGRLLRLDDLAVLWADTCAFEPGTLAMPSPEAEAAGAEAFYTAEALQRADGCADALLADLLGSRR